MIIKEVKTLSSLIPQYKFLWELQMSEKQSSQNTWIRQKFYLSWCCKQEIDKIWLAKVAIKNENITSFGGIYHIMDIFQSWALKNLPNLYWANVEVAAKYSVMEVFFVVFHTSPLAWVGDFMTMQEPRILENPHING